MTWHLQLASRHIILTHNFQDLVETHTRYLSICIRMSNRKSEKTKFNFALRYPPGPRPSSNNHQQPPDSKNFHHSPNPPAPPECYQRHPPLQAHPKMLQPIKAPNINIRTSHNLYIIRSLLTSFSAKRGRVRIIGAFLHKRRSAARSLGQSGLGGLCRVFVEPRRGDGEGRG